MNVFLLFWLWIGILVVNCEPKTTRVLNFKMSNLKSSAEDTVERSLKIIADKEVVGQKLNLL